MLKSRRGHSLAELIVVVVIIAVMSVVAVPRFSRAMVGRTTAETTAYTLMTDLRLTRSMAIRDAATNDKGYSLELTGASPYSGYTIENCKTHTVIATHTFHSGVTVNCPGAKKFVYVPMGNLKPDESGTQITVTGSGGTYTLTLDAMSATGIVKCTKS